MPIIVRGLLGTGPRTPPSNPPRPPLLKGSIWHRNRVKSGNRCWIDAELTSEEGRARQIRGWGLGGLCLINPSQASQLVSNWTTNDDKIGEELQKDKWPLKWKIRKSHSFEVKRCIFWVSLFETFIWDQTTAKQVYVSAKVRRVRRPLTPIGVCLEPSPPSPACPHFSTWSETPWKP